MESSEFFGADRPADHQEFNGYGQYLLDVDGKGKKAYSRATTVAKMLDNGKGLEVWEQRKAAKGVASSPALVARATVTPLDDKVGWREILDAAGVRSGGDEKRDLGTAFHALHEHVPTMTDDEWNAVPSDLQVTYKKYRAELERLGIEEVLTEGTCACTQLGTAGKFDAVFRLPDGRLVIGDRKSGRITEYPHSAAVQLAIYANADVLITYDESGATERHSMPELDKTTAIVVDIKIGDADTASVHVYEIDIWAGWAAALLSAKVRRWRNRRDLVTPYHPEFPPADRARNAATVERVPTALPEKTAPPRATPEQRADFAAELPPPSTGFPTEVAHGPAANAPAAAPHMAWSSAEQRNIPLDSQGERIPESTGTPVPAHPSGADVAQLDADVEALLAAFKTKAQLQAVLSTVHPGANLARQRKNLAADIVAHPSWPHHRTHFLPGLVAVPQETATMENGEEFSPVVTNAPGPVPPDPEPQYAPPVPPAPQADNPFTQPPAEPAPAITESLEDRLLLEIGKATSNDELGAIWQEANDSGIGWPPRLHQAATLRQKQLAAPAAQ